MRIYSVCPPLSSIQSPIEGITYRLLQSNPKGTMVFDNQVRLPDNTALQNDYVSICDSIYGGNNVSGKNLIAEEHVILRNNARANRIISGFGTTLGDNADIAHSIRSGVLKVGDFGAGKGLRVPRLTTGGRKIDLSKVKRLEQLTIQRPEFEDTVTLLLRSFLPKKRINLYLDKKLQSLDIRTPGGTQNILKHFRFFYSDTKQRIPKAVRENIVRVSRLA